MKTKIFLTILLAIISLSMLILATSCNSEINVQVKETGSFTDTRDGRIYKTIKIGEQWLMSENLAYKPEQGNYWAYDDDTANVAKYGYLYDWETAKMVAPKGWHLPTESDWIKLRKSLGGKRDVFKYLGGTMEIVYKQMVVSGCGFNALLCGIRSNNGKFMGLEDRTDFWSSSASKDGQYFYILDGKKDGKKRGFLDSKEGTAALAYKQDNAKGGKSVRLFKD
jgi:uncharacterized protein (TIGR02145 family)